MIAIGLSVESILLFILCIASMVVEEEGGADSPADGSKLHDLLATSITPKVIESLSNGFKQFNTTVASVNQVAGSFNTTQALIKEMENTTTDIISSVIICVLWLVGLIRSTKRFLLLARSQVRHRI